MEETGPLWIAWRPWKSMPSGYFRALVLTCAGLLLASALLLVTRRLSGALLRPLEPAALLARSLIVVAGANALRVGWRQLGAAAGAGSYLIKYGLALALVLLASAISVEGSSPWGLGGMWLVLLAGELHFFLWPMLVRRQKGFGQTYRLVEAEVENETIYSAAPIHGSPSNARSLDFEAFEGEQLLQRFSRVRDSEGMDVIYGELRVSLLSGERTQTLHVAFCPPFAETPELEVSQIDGPSAQVKPSQIQPYGARLDLRLDQPSRQPVTVAVEVVAHGAPLDNGSDGVRIE